MADFKVSGVTPRFGNIKVGNTNVKKIYQGGTLVWPFQDPPYFTTPTDRAQTYNPDPIAVGEAFEYKVRAKSDSFPNAGLTITSEDLPNGFSISATTIDGLTGDATATITGLISTGTLKFTLKVKDQYDQEALQEVILNGVVPDINSYFVFYFDSSGSMRATLPDLERDLLGANADDPTTLRYYLQKYFAVNTLEERSDGSERYNKQVVIKSSDSENWAYMLNNENAGVIPAEATEPSSVSVNVFLDEGGKVGVPTIEYLYKGDWISGQGYEYNDSDSYHRPQIIVSTKNTITVPYEFRVYEGELGVYRLRETIIAGSPESFLNPSESFYDRNDNPSGKWEMMSWPQDRNQDGVPFSFPSPLIDGEESNLMGSLTNLKSSINNNPQVKYSGAVYCVEYVNENFLGNIQSFYDALNNTPESRYFSDNNSLENYTNQIFFGNPKDPSNKYGVGRIQDGGTQPGYYTQLVLNSLNEQGYIGIEPYQG